MPSRRRSYQQGFNTHVSFYYCPGGPSLRGSCRATRTAGAQGSARLVLLLSELREALGRVGRRGERAARRQEHVHVLSSSPLSLASAATRRRREPALMMGARLAPHTSVCEGEVDNGVA